MQTKNNKAKSKPTRPAISKNRLLLLALLAVIGAIMYWGLRTQPIAVDLATIKQGDLTATVNEEGVTRIKEIYRVSAPVAGLLRRLSLKEGNRVKKNRTIVAVIEPLAPAFQDIRSLRILRAGVKSAQAALTLAKAELSRVEADRDYVQSDFSRTSRLYKKRVIARKIYDLALSRKRKASAAIAAARASVDVSAKELERARASLIQPASRRKKRKKRQADCCLSIPAPASGRVLKLLHKSEQVVSAGTPLLEIGDENNLEITVDLLSSEAVKVVPGAPALIEGWGGDMALKAHVKRIEPAGFTKVSALGIEEQRVRVLLELEKRASDAPPLRLGHDFRIFARIEVWSGKDLLLVPLSALFRKGDDWVVFVQKNGKAQLRTIRIGHRTRHLAQIESGLSKDERVVIHPSDRIEEGSAIKQREN